MAWEQSKTFIVQRALQAKFGANGKFGLIIETAHRAKDLKKGAKSLIEDTDDIKGHRETIIALKELKEDKWGPGYHKDKNGMDIDIPNK